jgi:phosphonate transport system substrate-binding protein
MFRLLAGLAAATMLAGTVAGAQAPPRSKRGDSATIQLAVISFYNPRLMYVKYQPLIDYLSEHTPWRFELNLGSSYEQTISRLCEGEVQVAYLGPFSYLRAHELCASARPVVRLNTAGAESYYSYIMVRQESRIDKLSELRGARFAFGTRQSTSSHLVPRLMLLEAGIVAGADLSCHYYDHHERAARAVLMGEAEACGVRDLTGDQFRGRGLRILARSEPIPNFPFAVGPGAPPGLETAILDALVELPRRDPSVARLMARWDAELSGGFVPVRHEVYLPVVEWAKKVFGPKALAMPKESLGCGR